MLDVFRYVFDLAQEGHLASCQADLRPLAQMRRSAWKNLISDKRTAPVQLRRRRKHSVTVGSSEVGLEKVISRGIGGVHPQLFFWAGGMRRRRVSRAVTSVALVPPAGRSRSPSQPALLEIHFHFPSPPQPYNWGQYATSFMVLVFFPLV